MKMIFLEEAAKDSGSAGFSDAWPLCDGQLLRKRFNKFQGTDHPAQTACTFIRSAISTMSSTFA